MRIDNSKIIRVLERKECVNRRFFSFDSFLHISVFVCAAMLMVAQQWYSVVIVQQK